MTYDEIPQGPVACCAPGCEHGTRQWSCLRCDGDGCVHCAEGLLHAPCAECDGTGTVSTALRWLQEHYRRLVSVQSPHPRHMGGLVLAWYQDRWWQSDPDPAAAALAYLALRPGLRGLGVTLQAMRPAHPYLTDAMDGVVTIRRDSLELVLSGARWGYRGHGAQILAAIATDLGIFTNLRSAVDCVANAVNHSDYDWSLRGPVVASRL